MKPGYVYVASSWRNTMHIAVCAALKSLDIDHYNFKQPTPDDNGFHWSSVMPSFNEQQQLSDMYEYITGLNHPIAEQGFQRDFEAMQKADACVLVLPCGRSAHLELGWMIGQGKRSAILLDSNDNNEVTPELMYKCADYIAPTFMDLLSWLGVED